MKDNDVFDLTLVGEVDGKHTTLTGKVRGVNIENKIEDDDIISHWDYDVYSKFRVDERYFLNAEFVKDDNDAAYRIKQKIAAVSVKPIVRTAEIEVEADTMDYLIAAQKACGAPGDAHVEVVHYPKRGHVATFTWGGQSG